MEIRESTKCKSYAKDVLALLMFIIAFGGILFALLSLYVEARRSCSDLHMQGHTSCSTYQDCAAAGLHEFECESNRCVAHSNGLKSQATMTHHDPPHVTYQKRSYIIAMSVGAGAVLLVIAIYAAFVCISEWKHNKSNSSDDRNPEQLITV